MLTTQNRAVAPPPPVTGSFEATGETVKLTKTVQSPQGPLNEIRLREPTFGDWLDCGDWQKFIREIDGRVESSIDPAAVGKWFQKLSGLPMAVIVQLSYQDGQRIYGALDRLVGVQRTGNSQTPPGNSG
jgi:hypothetical protein